MKDAYILFKDHKPNFENKLQSRLINPYKIELEIFSKILFKILCLIYKKLPITIFERIQLIQLNGLEILEIRVRPLLFNLT